MPPLRPMLAAALLLGPVVHAQAAAEPPSPAAPVSSERPESAGAQPSPAAAVAPAPGRPPREQAHPHAVPAGAEGVTPAGAPTELLRGPPQPRPEDFNQVSLFGGQALGAGRGAVGAFLGFPLLGVRGALGVTPWLDVGLGFESFYGVMNEVRAFVRARLLGVERWDVALLVEGGRAFFTQRPALEDRGARWLTGRRNWNLTPGLLVSLRGATPQAARLFADVRYHLAVDTEPYQRIPLGGMPAGASLSHNLPVRFGAELPFSPATSFLAQFGFDLHGHRADAPFVPVIGVGVVTAL